MRPERTRQWVIAGLACAAMLLLPAIAWLFARTPPRFVASAHPGGTPVEGSAGSPGPAPRLSPRAPRSTWPHMSDPSDEETPPAAAHAERVRGTVLDPDNRPVSGATVRCTDRDPPVTATTGDDGRFDLSADADGCAGIASSGELFPNDPVPLRGGDGNTLRLQRGGALEVEVVDEDSAPLASYLLSIESYQGKDPDRSQARQVRTVKDPRGAFTWDHLPSGRYVLTTSADGRPPVHSEGVDVDGARPTRVRMTLARGATLRGQVTDAVTHKPLAGATVALDGLTVTGAQAIAPGTSDDQGNYAVEGVPPGPFSIRVSHAGYRGRVITALRTGGAKVLRQDAELSPQTEGGPRGDEFAGIGAFLDGNAGAVAFARLVAGGPAEQAGIQAGDVVRRIDGADASSLTMVECMQRLRGSEGSRVTIQLDRGGQTVDVTVQRRAMSL